MEPTVSSLAPRVVKWQPLVAAVATGLALWRLPFFSVRAPVQVLDYVLNQMICKYPGLSHLMLFIIYLTYILFIYAFIYIYMYIYKYFIYLFGFI